MIDQTTLLYIVTGVAAIASGALVVRRRTERFAERAKDQKTAKALRELGSEVVAPYFEARARGEGKVRERVILDNIEDVLSDAEKRSDHLERLLKHNFPRAIINPDIREWAKKEITKAEPVAPSSADS